jgi:hypothetical protein
MRYFAADSKNSQKNAVFSGNLDHLARFLLSLSLSLSLSLLMLTSIFFQTGSFGCAKTAEVSAAGGYPLTAIFCFFSLILTFPMFPPWAIFPGYEPVVD